MGAKATSRVTKLTTYEDAYEYAKNELLRLQHAAKLGHSLDDYTFENIGTIGLSATRRMALGQRADSIGTKSTLHVISNLTFKTKMARVCC